MQKSRARGSGAVRIVGGEWRGRRIHIPAHAPVRPTPDRVRETLFNWLSGAVTGARCLDLFAGTGVLGLEALSRGAEEAWLVERDAGLARALEERVASLEANARVIHGSALEVLTAPSGTPFDIVFADPPYDMGLPEILQMLPPLLSRDNLIYVERPVRPGENPLEDAASVVPGARVLKRSRAGRVAYGLLRL